MRCSIVPRWRLLVLVGMLVSIALTGAPAPSPAAAAPSPSVGDVSPAVESAAPQLVRLRFGSPQAISDAGVFIGQDRGYFREQGLEVETLPFQSGPDTIPALAAGELEIAGGTISIALLNAVDRGIALKMVADKGSSRPGFEFVQTAVRRDLLESGTVRDVADLRGRKFAVASLRSGAEAHIHYFLARGGLTLADIDLVPLGYPDMIVAFGNRAIDAANIIEPSLSAAIDQSGVTTWEQGRASGAYGAVYQAATLVYSGQFAAQSDQARRFMVAYLQGVRAYNDAFVKGQDRANVVRILTENTPVKNPAAYERMNMAGLDPDGRIATTSLQMDMEFFRQQGYYSGPTTLESLIDASYVEYAGRQLGPYR